MEPCQYGDDIKEMKQDIKTLLQFKWQMSGGWVWISIAACVVLSVTTTALAVAQYLK